MRLRTDTNKWLVQSGGHSHWTTEDIKEASFFTSYEAREQMLRFQKDDRKPNLTIITEMDYQRQVSLSVRAS